MTRSVFTHRDQVECALFWREAATLDPTLIPSMSPDELEYLRSITWPGSQFDPRDRELHDLVERELSQRQLAGSHQREGRPLYHWTSPQAAEEIKRTKRFLNTKGDNRDSAFFSTDPESEYGKGFGNSRIDLDVPDELFDEETGEWGGGEGWIDDEFPSGEQHWALPMNRIRPEWFRTARTTEFVEPGVHQGWERIPGGVGWQHPTGGVIMPNEDHFGGPKAGLWQLWGPTVSFMGHGGGLAMMKKPVPDPQELMDWWAWTEGESDKSVRHAAMILDQAHYLLAECKPGDPNCTSAMGLQQPSAPPSGPKAPAGTSSSYTIFDPAEWQSAVSHDYPPNAYNIKSSPGYSTPSSPSSSSAPVSYSPSAGVDQWRPHVEEGLRRNNLPLSLAPQVLKQIQTESSGNPNAINLSDVNAQAGHPSQGLLQTIPSTFNTYRLPGDPDSITDPQANIDAAINYAKDTYGPTLMNEQGRGIGSGSGY